MQRVEITITPQGKATLEMIRGKLLLAAVQSLKVVAEKVIRPEVAKVAPSPQVEATILSAGITAEGKFAGKPSDGRFFKASGQLPVQQAIALEKAQISGNTITLGHCATLNRLTAFSWKRWDGTVLSTMPFYYRWLQQLEYGGVGEWIVEPREGRKQLWPDEHTRTKMMTKTVPPYSMYQKGFSASIAQLKAFLAMDITKRMKW